MIVSFDEIPDISEKNRGSKIGLITGSFDVLHPGHISAFEFACNRVDLLYVGVDSDKSVTLNKGDKRPYYDHNIRMKMLDSIRYIDYVFLVDHKLRYFDPLLIEYFSDLYENSKITHLITHKQGDPSYKTKEKSAKNLGITFLLQEEKKFTSSSKVLSDFGLD